MHIFCLHLNILCINFFYKHSNFHLLFLRRLFYYSILNIKLYYDQLLFFNLIYLYLSLFFTITLFIIFYNNLFYV